MKLNQLYYFKYVCKYMNITKAANSLHISQPAITKAIRDLEEELGVTLLIRTNKNVALTNEGTIFLNKSTSILSQLESLIDEMRDLGNLRRTSVRIGIPPAVGSVVLPQLNQIAARKFSLELEIVEMSSVDAEEAVKNDELDLAVILLEDDFYPNIDYTILQKSCIHFCTSIHNPLSKAAKIHISELTNERIIFFYPGELMQRTFKSYGVTPKYILRSNQLVTIRNYIRENLASTLQFPEAFAKDPLIRTIPLANEITQNISIIKKKGKRLSSGASQLYQYLSEHPKAIFHTGI